eukprot:IDg4509t1
MRRSGPSTKLSADAMATSDIVDVMIGELLFDIDDESVASNRAKALSIFKLHPDVALDCNEDVYYVKLVSVRRFKMVLGFVSKGASFRSAARFVDVAREVTKLQYLRGCTEAICASYVRIICATSLQGIAQLLRQCWAYYYCARRGPCPGDVVHGRQI